MKVLDGRELLISATKEGTSFFLGLLAWKLGKVEVRPFLDIFAHRNGTKLHIRLAVTPILLSK